MFLDKLAKQRVIYPIRKLALLLARRWPFPIEATLYDGSRMWVDLRSAVGRAIIVKGEFDQAVWRAIEPHLNTGSVFLDVGANVGYYSLLASSYVGKAGQVHAFEIDPRPLRCLRKNAAVCTNRNVTVHERAVSDIIGIGALLAKPDCGHSSVQQEGHGMKVQMVTLDHWMDEPGAPDHIDVIKLDIEGGELAALEGARNLIGRLRPFIVCEALDEKANEDVPGQAKLLNYFASMNYSTHVAHGTYSPTLVAAPL